MGENRSGSSVRSPVGRSVGGQEMAVGSLARHSRSDSSTVMPGRLLPSHIPCLSSPNVLRNSKEYSP